MDNKSFWLVDLHPTAVAISLVNYVDGNYVVSAVGSPEDFIPERESLNAAADKSLNFAAESISLPEDQEPDSAALILPPLWIGSDGKISPQYLKLVEYLCRDLDLKPMGFITNDEAVVEDANHSEGFPVSFVLVDITATEMAVSLAYLGKVIERLLKPLHSPFSPSILESALTEFKTESTLPPQIILFGDINEGVVDSIKNYPWIGKKDTETFLHLPDIKAYSPLETVQVYTRAITSQFSAPTNHPSDFSESEPTETELVESDLSEVDASDLGFSASAPPKMIDSDNLVIPPSEEISLPSLETTFSSDSSETETVAEVSSSTRPKSRLSFPKLAFPHFHLPTLNWLLAPLVILPLLILIPFLFSKADIVLSFTPYNFDKQVQVTLDPTVSSYDSSQKIVPVKQQTFDINTSASVPTTGQKTVGDKAKGEVVIFNKQDKVQNLSSGTVLIDSQGNKYELSSSVQVAASSSDLNAGVITLGQTKVIISAADIGPEYNLAADTQLHFKDYAETILVAKVSGALSGGNKRQINAVSSADKTSLEKKMTETIDQSVDEKLTQTNGISGLIKNSTQVKKSRLVYSREIGEEADELSATATSTVTVYYLTDDQKKDILNNLLSSESGFNEADINPGNFELSLVPVSTDNGQVKGTLTIKGTAVPKVNAAAVSQLLSGKSLSRAAELIKSSYPRVYNFEINTNFRFLQSINPLPFLRSHITVEVK